MRILESLIVGAVLLAPIGCGTTPTATERSHPVANTIQAGISLAGIEIGMPEAAVEALMGAPRLVSEQSRHYPERHLTIFIIDGKVNTILMLRPCSGEDQFASTLPHAVLVRTAAGVGLGSSRDEVVGEFGEPERQHSVEDALVLAYPTKGIEFQTGQQGVCQIIVRPASKG